MLALLLGLSLATIEPPGAEMDRLDGAWLGENGTVLLIEARSATIAILSEDGEFVGQLRLYPRLHMLRMADNISTVERRYRLDGRQLTIGEFVYQRRPFLSSGER